MNIEFVKGGAMRPGTVAVGVWDGGALTDTGRAIDGGGGMSRVIETMGFGGERGATRSTYAPFGIKAPRVVLIGLGKRGEALTTAQVRDLGGKLGRVLLAGREETATVALEHELSPDQAAELALGIRLAAYRPLTAYKTKADPDAPTPRLESVAIRVADPDAAQAAWVTLEALTKGVYLARDLVNEPANRLTPADFCARAQDMEKLGLTVEVLTGEALAEAGLDLLAAVGRASANPPALCVVRWPGHAGKKKVKPLVFVGKGVTFDSGGISIKPAKGMEDMKMDMGGAAAVLGALGALAAADSPVPAVGVLALAENMPGANALRPGDILRSHAGLTVEVVDTDAEGRLVLADALAWAARSLSPRLMVDVATLTGAVVVALGSQRAGLFANDDALAAKLMDAGEETGERLWRLPLSADHDEALTSEGADIRNCAWGRFLPDALHAARFLERFVETGRPVPWAHVDIAGVADTDEDDWPLGPKGATGFGVALLTRLAESYGL